MTWIARREKLRALMVETRWTNPASVFDPMSARIAEDLGFDVMMLGGSVAAYSVYGAPDLNLLSLTEFAETCHRICRAGTIPLMVDADHGFGNALSVMRTVEELEVAGVGLLSIEDTALPAVYGQGAKPRLIPIEEGVGKMKAAVAARRDKTLVIAARSSSFGFSTMADAVERARAYDRTGVDCHFIGGITTRAQLDALAEATSLPIILGTVTPEMADAAYLNSRRVSISLFNHASFAFAMKAVEDTLKAQLAGADPRTQIDKATNALIKRISREGDYARYTADFLDG